VRARRATGEILVVAALERELASVRKSRNSGLSLLETGQGPENCERALRRRLNGASPCFVLGIGLAGALSDSLSPGDLVLVNRVEGVDARPPARLLTAVQAVPLELKSGVAVTVDEVVCEAASKRRLASAVRPGDLAIVDMESSALARVCGEKSVPFLIVRAVSDLVDEDLPIDFNRCRTRSGRVSTTRVVIAAAARPGAIRGLRELERRARLCAGRLAEFVEQFAGLVEVKLGESWSGESARQDRVWL
jgi:adenosylhomocysteine nucleosidase